jgi:hypothetical protein
VGLHAINSKRGAFVNSNASRLDGSYVEHDQNRI